MTRVRATAGRHAGQVGETGATFSGGFLVEVAFDDGTSERFRPYELVNVANELPWSRSERLGHVVEIDGEGPIRHHHQHVRPDTVIWLSVDGEGRGHTVAEWLALEPSDYPPPALVHLPRSPDAPPSRRRTVRRAAIRIDRAWQTARELMGRQGRS